MRAESEEEKEEKEEKAWTLKRREKYTTDGIGTE